MDFKKLLFSIALSALASFTVGALSAKPQLTQQDQVLIATSVEAWKFSAVTVFSLSIASRASRR